MERKAVSTAASAVRRDVVGRDKSRFKVSTRLKSPAKSSESVQEDACDTKASTSSFGASSQLSAAMMQEGAMGFGSHEADHINFQTAGPAPSLSRGAANSKSRLGEVRQK
jgi:hypothetical protein